jgi:hypothetical protein
MANLPAEVDILETNSLTSDHQSNETELQPMASVQNDEGQGSEEQSDASELDSETQNDEEKKISEKILKDKERIFRDF